MSKPKIGVISDCALQRHMLTQALCNYHIQIAVNCGPDLLEQQPDDKVSDIECWVLALKDEDADYPAIEQLIEHADQTPVLFGLENAPNKDEEAYISWERRLCSKLSEFVGSLETLDSAASLLSLGDSEHSETTLVDGFKPETKVKSKEIWVLAASLGGPAAVKEFLDLIPASIRAGFYYAQHIDKQNSQVLTKVLGRHSNLNLVAAENGMELKDGEVAVVPVDHEINFSNDKINFCDNEWEGPYGPSIDHLLRNLYGYYGTRCHVIIFSGMGNDGAMLAPKMRASGCHVWAQSPETCASSSMPQSVIDLNCHNFVGTPSELAHAFIKQVGCYTQEDFKKSI